jgi:2'-5' RNA ligase
MDIVTETYPAMIALYPDEDTKNVIARLTEGVENAYNPDDLHCTVVFLGDKFPYAANPINNIITTLRSLSRRLPFYAEVSAQTQFGEDYSVLLVDGKGIAELYTDVSRRLLDIGIQNASEHGYCAHMSVVTGPSPDLDAVLAPLVFDRMVLAIGPYRYTIGF